MPMPVPSAAPVTAPFWPGVMFSHPPRKPATMRIARIFVLIMVFSRYRLPHGGVISAFTQPLSGLKDTITPAFSAVCGTEILHDSPLFSAR